MSDKKEIRWIGTSYEDLLRFPVGARKDAGFQLGKIQAELDPTNFKPFDQVGAGVKELRLSDQGDAYRVMYVAKFEEAIYVLHCFQKKTRQTSERDKALVSARYRAVIAERKSS